MYRGTGVARSGGNAQDRTRQRNDVLRSATDAGSRRRQFRDCCTTSAARSGNASGSTVPAVQAQADDPLHHADVFEGLIDPAIDYHGDSV